MIGLLAVRIPHSRRASLYMVLVREQKSGLKSVDTKRISSIIRWVAANEGLQKENKE